MASTGDLIVFPFVIVIIYFVDVASWQVFSALAGSNAILYMTGLILAEFALIASYVRSILK